MSLLREIRRLFAMSASLYFGTEAKMKQQWPAIVDEQVYADSVQRPRLHVTIWCPPRDQVIWGPGLEGTSRPGGSWPGWGQGLAQRGGPGLGGGPRRQQQRWWHVHDSIKPSPLSRARPKKLVGSPSFKFNSSLFYFAAHKKSFTVKRHDLCAFCSINTHSLCLALILRLFRSCSRWYHQVIRAGRTIRRRCHSLTCPHSCDHLFLPAPAIRQNPELEQKTAQKQFSLSERNVQ